MAETTEDWLPLREWCEKYGDSLGAAHKRVADGTWQRGFHYSSPEGHNAFVHERRCKDWMVVRGKLPAE